MELIDIVLVVLIFVLCLCIAWKIGWLGVAAVGAIVKTGGGDDISPGVMEILEEYKIGLTDLSANSSAKNKVRPAEAAKRAASAHGAMSPPKSRQEKISAAILDAIQHHWIYSLAPNSVSRAANHAAVTVAKSMISTADARAITVVRAPDEVKQAATAPRAADYFREIEMRRLAGAEKSQSVDIERPSSADLEKAQSELARKSAEVTRVEADLRASEDRLRTSEADLRSARDDIRRLRDGTVSSLSSTAFLAECNADRKLLQERVYQLRQEVANVVAKCGSTADATARASMQPVIDDLRARNSHLEAQLHDAIRSARASPPPHDSSHTDALAIELANCRRLLDEVLSAQ